MMRSEIARKGGEALHKKYGSEYMSDLGIKGAVAQKLKYEMIPIGIADFAYKDRLTGKFNRKTLRGLSVTVYGVPDDQVMR